MSEEPMNDRAPAAEVRTGKGFSIIWVIPIIALLIGGWLAYKAMQEKGPEITITFADADGLEAGKTAIKFKNMEIGKVGAITLLPDLSGVQVTAEMNNGTEKFMNDKTQFWVVRARVAAGEVSGLGTLLSGAYIGCNLSVEGLHRRDFKGLEKPPILTEGMPGRHFILRSPTLGSLDVGSPVYYRGVKVGSVVGYDFDKNADNLLIKIFVDAPYHEKVTVNTRFWNASGINLTINAAGVKMDTQSLVSVVLGGVAFDLSEYDQAGKQADNEATFQLYDDRESSKQGAYAVKSYFLMYFDQSVRGLTVGAPVEIKGIRIGEVVKVELLYDQEEYDFKVPVLVMIEPERMNMMITEEGKVLRGEQMDELLLADSLAEKHGLMRPQRLVDKGLRAQLKTGSLLTGQLYVDLAFYPEAPPAKLHVEQGYLVFPTVPQPLERMLQRADTILKQVEDMHLDTLGKTMNDSFSEMKKLVADLRLTAGAINEQTIPQLNRKLLPEVESSLKTLDKTLSGIDQTFGPESPLSYNIPKLSEDLLISLRSLRSLLDYLERNPQALILGKGGDKK
ncbi:MAG: intermembrane transport protein PqiB [Desulfopila sp.]